MKIFQRPTFCHVLSDLDPKNNSIGFVRLVCAVLVLAAHAWPYGGFGEEPLARLSNNQVGTGRVPVDVFFIVSGYLIAMSWCNTPNWRVFAWHRFLRIYPAYLVCVTLTGIVVAWAVRGQSDISYVFKSAPLITGFVAHIPGVFEGKPGGSDVNSSLWTLPWEVRAYVMIAIFGRLGFVKRGKLIVASIFVFSVCRLLFLIYSYPGLATSPAVTSGWRLISFFLAGVVCFQFRDHIVLNWKLFFVSMVILLLGITIGIHWVHYSLGMFYSVAHIPLAYAVFFVATRIPFAHINAKTDISYGVYIYGTLIINIISDNDICQSYLTFLALTLALTLPIAYLSWIYVEKPALSMKDRMPFSIRSHQY